MKKVPPQRPMTTGVASAAPFHLSSCVRQGRGGGAGALGAAWLEPRAGLPALQAV
jgi:hypothetical protein